MTTTQLIFTIYIVSLIAVQFATLWKIFEKAGEEKWKAFVPGYNLFVWLRMMKKPWWWIFFFIIDGVNFLMLIVLNIETARTFRKFSWQETVKSILLPHWTYIELAFGDAKYFGQTDWEVPEQVQEREVSDHITLFLSLPVLGHAAAYLLTFGSEKRRKKSKYKGKIKEWNDAIVFAIVAASIIRTFIFEPFTIPTPSMEKDLLVGDYLFVSKVSYGPKAPNTPLSIPFFHNYIPVLGTKSYLEWIHRPYRRLPGLGDVERNDVVVFNFPAGDTAIYDPGVEGLMGHTYKQIVAENAFQYWYSSNRNKPLESYENVKKQFHASARQKLVDQFGLIHRPVDKRENYIKRCVAVAGDKIEIRNSKLIVNGDSSVQFDEMQYNYWMNLPQSLSMNTLQQWKEDYGITPSQYVNWIGAQHIYLGLTQENYNTFKNAIGEENIKRENKPRGFYNSIPTQLEYWQSHNINAKQNPGLIKYYPIYPNHPKFDWTEDNFGPLIIPEEGMTIELTEDNWILYKRCIEVYEGHEIKEEAGKYFIDGKEQSSYTFEMDYYWMMGDNRHQSADSRFWGFVPEDHVVGKAVFIWFSVDPEDGMFGGGIRFDRIFTGID